MVCAVAERGPWPWRRWIDLDVSDWASLCAPSSAAGRWCEYQPRKDLGRPAEQKVKRVPRQLQRGPIERCVCVVGVAFVLMEKKWEGVRVCKGICHRGETARAEDSICVEVGGRGFNTIRAAWTEDRLSLCSWLGSTSLRPRRRWRKRELKIWWLCCLTNCLICTTLCGSSLKRIFNLCSISRYPSWYKWNYY